MAQGSQKTRGKCLFSIALPQPLPEQSQVGPVSSAAPSTASAPCLPLQGWGGKEAKAKGCSPMERFYDPTPHRVSSPGFFWMKGSSQPEMVSHVTCWGPNPSAQARG